MNWLKQKAARWLLGKAVTTGEKEAEKAIAQIPQSQRSTALGIICWALFLAKNAYALFDGDATTNIDIQPDVLDAVLTGQGTAFLMMREQRAHEEEKRIRKEAEIRSAIQ